MSTAFASANDTTDQKAQAVELARGVYGYVSQSDPNCGFVVGDDSVLVIDARATPALANEMLEDIRRITDKPVRHVFLTHYHAVRALGASAFTGATVMASNDTLHLIRERGAADMESEIRRFPRLFKGAEAIPGLTLPQVTFERDLSLWFGGRELKLLHLGRGHSRGDAVCWIPDAGVVFAGDLVENHCGVYTGDAYMRDWMVTLERLRAIDAPVVVPGRGPAMLDRHQVSDAIDGTKDFVLSVLESVEIGLKAGKGLADCYRIAEERMTPRFGDWPIFVHALAFDVGRAYDELRGLEHPRIWTAERDRELWDAIHGR